MGGSLSQSQSRTDYLQVYLCFIPRDAASVSPCRDDAQDSLNRLCSALKVKRSRYGAFVL